MSSRFEISRNATADYELTLMVTVSNCEKLLPGLIAQLQDYLLGCHLKSCVLFVDDCSQDESLAVIRDCCLRLNDFYYLTLQHPGGPSAVLKAGLLAVSSPWCALIDAQRCAKVSELDLLLQMRTDMGLVCGERRPGKGRGHWRRSLVPALCSAVRRLVTHDGIRDSHCPLQVGQTAVLRALPWFSGMHCFVPALVRLSGYGVTTVSVSCRTCERHAPLYRCLGIALGSFFDLLAYIWIRRHYLDPAVARSNVRPV